MTLTARTFAVEDPATLQLVAVVPDFNVDQALEALARAANAFRSWSQSSLRHRSDVLRRAHDFMLRDASELIELIVSENGKSFADAAAEVSYAAEFFRWYSEEAVRPGGEFGETPAGGVRTLVSHRAVGVAALVTPWNFPAAMATRKLAPALAAGCTAVLKPAAETPLTALAIARILADAGLPDGAAEVVTTTDASGVVGAWLSDPRVRKVSFTGSTGVGRLLLRQAADRVLNASMELGGNAPVVVTEDADLGVAVAGTMDAKFRNGGQACTAANRIYVHRKVVEEFVVRLGAEVERLSVGSARDGAAIGPLISASAADRVGRVVDRAVEEGARVTHRAQVPDSPGYFYPPTVLVDVQPGATILQEEIFGPIAPVVAWDDEDTLIEQINDSEFGLAAYVFARDLQRALRLGERIDAGMIGINRGLLSDPSAPFGGLKQSGLGREGAREGLREFQETQYMSISWAE